MGMDDKIIKRKIENLMIWKFRDLEICRFNERNRNFTPLCALAPSWQIKKSFILPPNEQVRPLSSCHSTT